MIQLSSYSGGTLVRHENFPSQHVQARHVDVWCPPGYEDGAALYPVLYMHDGQNLFEPDWSYLGVDWGIDEAIGRLMAAGVTGGAIVVGIWHGPQRHRDYMPQMPLMAGQARAPLERFVREQGGPPESDAYLRFLVDELKPFVDAAYRTRPDRAHTLVMGSSMGGLISLYALTEYPAIFGRAGCVSTHWPIGGSLLVDYFGSVLPRPGDHRIYFDYGTETADADYEPYQLQMDALLQAAGYRHGQDWITRKFAGAEHSERAWRARVDVPLRFLLA
jgi:predicted alpha/beta superfamily hydrolase